MFRDEMKKAAEDFGLTLSESQLTQFTRYYELLVEWNEKMNLTAITEEHEVAVKHMVDSLSAYDPALFDGEISIIDVGTGAGFPGLPLKIFCPQVHLTLMDSLNKRVNFLQTVVDELGLEDVDCVHARAEEGARMKKYREQYDLAVSRAVARLPILCEYCLPFVKVGGWFVPYKSGKLEEEMKTGKGAIRKLGGELEDVISFHLANEDERNLVRIHKTERTGKKYPRKAGTPSREPLK